jgi:hypothetical protein
MLFNDAVSIIIRYCNTGMDGLQSRELGNVGRERPSLFWNNV